MKTFLKLRVVASTMIAIILMCTAQHIASADIIWGVTIDHRADTQDTPTSIPVVYASDSLSTFFLDGDEYRGTVDYTLSPFSGLGELVLILEDSTLTVSYDLSLVFTQDGQANGIEQTRVFANVFITPYAPIGDEISISVSNNLTTSGFAARRDDSLNSPIVDIDLEGFSDSGVGGVESIFVDGVEYGQLVENNQLGYTRFRVQQGFAYNNTVPSQSRSAKGTITVEARNLSVPEPSSIPFVLLAALLTLQRRRTCLGTGMSH